MLLETLEPFLRGTAGSLAVPLAVSAWAARSLAPLTILGPTRTTTSSAFGRTTGTA